MDHIEDITNPVVKQKLEGFTIPFSKKYYSQYALLVMGQVVFFFFCVVSYFTFNVNGAKNMYKRMFASVIRAKLSFFDTTPQGRIINRLVKDTEAVDFVFGRFLLITTVQLSMLAGMIISICVITWPCLFVVIPCFVIYFFIFRRFRSITPQLKRLEAQSRSKVFSICQETMDQLTTIRAYGM